MQFGLKYMNHRVRTAITEHWAHEWKTYDAEFEAECQSGEDRQVSLAIVSRNTMRGSQKHNVRTSNFGRACVSLVFGM